MSEHLSSGVLNSMADGELSAVEMSGVMSHLAECSKCTTSALEQMMLKKSSARAGQRYVLTDEVRERLARTASSQASKNETAGSEKISPGGGIAWWGWSAVAAVLVVSLGIGLGVERRTVARTEEAALITEVCDLHVAALAASGPPEVVSSDRHTVKPWFQGKIPFSFNLPDGLAGDTALLGADLIYLERRPVAQLLYTIGKHRVSVFLREKAGIRLGENSSGEQSGFHVVTLEGGELEIVAVSDVEPARLDALARSIAAVQGADR